MAHKKYLRFPKVRRPNFHRISYEQVFPIGIQY